MSIKFSVIICAYNASNRIIRPLEHICKLNYPTELFELIVVDNNSNDDTSLTVLNFLKNSGARFDYQIIKEENQGLIHARIAGIIKAKFDYVVFVDDDNLLNSDYLRSASKILGSNQKIGAIGGQVDLKTDLESLPPWFYSHANSYAVGTQADEDGDISRRGYLWGAGIIIKKSLMQIPIENNIRFALSGRSGSKLTSGDDSEMCKWILISGHILYYSSDLILTHVIPNTRINENYLNKLRAAMRDSGSILTTYDRWLWRNHCRKQILINPFSWILSEFRFLAKQNSTSKIITEVINQLLNVYKKSSL